MLVTLSDIMSDVMTFAELKFDLEKWRKGKFDVYWNDLNWDISVYYFWKPIITRKV